MSKSDTAKKISDNKKVATIGVTYPVVCRLKHWKSKDTLMKALRRL